MNRIAFLLPYFGKWPVWFEANLISCKYNPTIDWHIFTDCPIPENHPENVKFISTSLSELNKKINDGLELKVPLGSTPRKFCDLKPAYGFLFEEYLQGYDFWGICDLDIIWGDIRSFISNDILENYIIISSQEKMISGHFCLFKNIPRINNLYREVRGYQEFFQEPRFVWFDEKVYSNHINSLVENSPALKVYWPPINEINKQALGVEEYVIDKWKWRNGKLFLLRGSVLRDEIIYLHLLNWKKTIKICELNYNKQSTEFYISYNGIKQHPYRYDYKLIKNNYNKLFGYNLKLILRRIKGFSIINRISKQFLHKLS